MAGKTKQVKEAEDRVDQKTALKEENPTQTIEPRQRESCLARVRLEILER